jgi:hypothetical protein
LVRRKGCPRALLHDVEETTVRGLVLPLWSVAVIPAYVQLPYSLEKCYLQALSPCSMSGIGGIIRHNVAVAPKTLYTSLPSNINNQRGRIHQRQVLRISPDAEKIFTFLDGGIVWTAYPGQHCGSQRRKCRLQLSVTP